MVLTLQQSSAWLEGQVTEWKRSILLRDRPRSKELFNLGVPFFDGRRNNTIQACLLFTTYSENLHDV